MRKPYKRVKVASLKRRLRRKLKIRKTVSGTAQRPRLCVVKSSKNLQVQVIDDENKKTIFAVQTFGKNKVADKNNKDGAKSVGVAVANKMKEHSLETAVFDRNGQTYTGVIAVLADSIRENGIRI